MEKHKSAARKFAQSNVTRVAHKNLHQNPNNFLLLSELTEVDNEMTWSCQISTHELSFAEIEIKILRSVIFSRNMCNLFWVSIIKIYNEYHETKL